MSLSLPQRRDDAGVVIPFNLKSQSGVQRSHPGDEVAKSKNLKCSRRYGNHQAVNCAFPVEWVFAWIVGRLRRISCHEGEGQLANWRRVFRFNGTVVELPDY